MRLGALVAMLAACGFQPQAVIGGGDSASGDAGTDGPDAMSGTTGNVCYGTGGIVEVCFATAPTGGLHLPGSGPNPLDTGDNNNCTLVYAQVGDNREICVIASGKIAVDGAFTAIGRRPLVLVSASTIDVSQTLDVSSTWNPARAGAGTQASECTASTNGANDRGGGGGGAGGSFSITGGAGGIGDSNSNGPPDGTAPGGVAGAAQATPTLLRGGCKGGGGGEGDDSTGVNPGGPGGLGGGAVALVANTSIMIGGAVYASGSGGGTVIGSTSNCLPGNGGFEIGAGGGGSGGMIVLEAPVIMAPGKLAANGGAGAGGGACFGGQPGGDGSTTMWNQAAVGGVGDTTNGGANGANGTALGHTTNLDGLEDISGGGGGGGGLGVIWTRGTLTGTQISPAALTH